nr:hypothetical protein [Mobiluncus sp. Marseille-Q7826]
MSRRENGVGGIKAMPSGHCAAGTPNRKAASSEARMSRRENGECGIKAMPSGHCATETSNRKTAATQSHEPQRKTVLIPNFYT